MAEFVSQEKSLALYFEGRERQVKPVQVNLAIDVTKSVRKSIVTRVIQIADLVRVGHIDVINR